MDYHVIVDRQAETLRAFEQAHELIATESEDAHQALANLIDLALTVRLQKEALASIEEKVRETVREIMVDELHIDAFTSNMGQAAIVAGSEYPDYDNKALETLVISDSDLRERLLPFRTIRTRKPALRISQH